MRIQTPTLITFDGYQGSGKSTLINMLQEKLEVSTPTFTTDDHVKGDCDTMRIERYLGLIHRSIARPSNHPITILLNRLHSIKNAQANQRQWNREAYILASLFWDAILEFGADDSILSAFRSIVKSGDGYEPTLSFYLKSSTTELNRRIANRGFGGKVANYADDTVEWLSQSIPFFYVIDATQPISEVFTQTLEVIKEHGRIGFKSNA